MFLRSIGTIKTDWTLKYLGTILVSCFLISSFVASGNGTLEGTEGEEKNKDKKELNTESKNASETLGTKQSEEAEKKEESRQELKKAREDSTSNSVNKLNFVFYFIYKYKYSSPAETIRKLFE